MPQIEVVRDLRDEKLTAVRDLLAIVEVADGHAALNEHAWLDLVHGGRAEYAGFIARHPGHDHPVGYAHLSCTDDMPRQWALEVAVDPEHRGIGVELALAEAALGAARAEGGGHLHYWVFQPTEMHDALAHHLGLRRGRDLLQMRRPLPIRDEPEFPAGARVRTFVPGQDDDAWLAINNRAFGGHPEQGNWDHETLARRQAEPWFDPKGFILVDDDDGLAGFCWTKIHELDGHPHLGEIYVIGVDPARGGAGLGRALVLAGLHWLADRGCRIGMLYVDARNGAAVHLYESLRFSVDHRDRAYVADL